MNSLIPDRYNETIPENNATFSARSPQNYPESKDMTSSSSAELSSRLPATITASFDLTSSSTNALPAGPMTLASLGGTVCSPPPSVPGASVYVYRDRYGAVAVYTCAMGSRFVFGGTARTVICIDGVWGSDNPICEGKSSVRPGVAPHQNHITTTALTITFFKQLFCNFSSLNFE